MSLDLRTEQPVWAINHPSIPRHRKLANDIRCQVLVVGGGVSGALIAHKLTDLGMKVTIIDSREIGAGSTMASTAILSYEADVNLIELIRKIGEHSAVRAYRAGIEAIDSIGETVKALDSSCDFRRRESLYLASGRKDSQMMRRECKATQRHKFNVELLDRRALRTEFSLDAPRAILSHDAAEVNPRKLTLALVRSAQRKGLRFFLIRG
jgi:glycine/D-amino acid oxidase-like deaminating enzyme